MGDEKSYLVREGDELIFRSSQLFGDGVGLIRHLLKSVSKELLPSSKRPSAGYTLNELERLFKAELLTVVPAHKAANPDSDHPGSPLYIIEDNGEFYIGRENVKYKAKHAISTIHPNQNVIPIRYYVDDTLIRVNMCTAVPYNGDIKVRELDYDGMRNLLDQLEKEFMNFATERLVVKPKLFTNENERDVLRLLDEKALKFGLTINKV